MRTNSQRGATRKVSIVAIRMAEIQSSY